jgi:hypothetical protein
MSRRRVVLKYRIFGGLVASGILLSKAFIGLFLNGEITDEFSFEMNSCGCRLVTILTLDFDIRFYSYF